MVISPMTLAEPVCLSVVCSCQSSLTSLSPTRTTTPAWPVMYHGTHSCWTGQTSMRALFSLLLTDKRSFTAS